MSIRKLDTNSIIYEIKSKLDQFRYFNPLEYDNIIQNYVIIDPDVLAGAEIRGKYCSGRCIIISYKDVKIVNEKDKPLIHNCSVADVQEKSSELCRMIIYHNKPNSKNSEYELRQHVSYVMNENHPMTVDYFISNLLIYTSILSKYKNDKSFQKLLDILNPSLKV